MLLNLVNHFRIHLSTSLVSSPFGNLASAGLHFFEIHLYPVKFLFEGMIIWVHALGEEVAMIN